MRIERTAGDRRKPIPCGTFLRGKYLLKNIAIRIKSVEKTAELW